MDLLLLIIVGVVIGGIVLTLLPYVFMAIFMVVWGVMEIVKSLYYKIFERRSDL